MRSIPTYLALSALLLSASPAFARDRWERINDEDGISVYSKKVAGSDLIAFKGVGMVNAPIAKVYAVLANNSRRTEWVDRLTKSRVLERIDAFDVILYQVFEAPMFISDRDYVYRAKASKDANGHIHLRLHSVRHEKAPKTVGVRAELIDSAYELIPVGRYRTRVKVEIHTDPKGMIPTTIVNYVQKSWPLKTLKGIRKQVKRRDLKLLPLPPRPKRKATTVSAATEKKQPSKPKPASEPRPKSKAAKPD